MKFDVVNRNLALIYAAAFLRSASIGLLGVVLAVYLSRIGFNPTAIGFVLAAGLVGSAVATPSRVASAKALDAAVFSSGRLFCPPWEV